MNSPSDINTRRAWKYVMDHRDTNPVYIEHMVLMLCAHETDGPTTSPTH